MVKCLYMEAFSEALLQCLPTFLLLFTFQDVFGVIRTETHIWGGGSWISSSSSFVTWTALCDNKHFVPPDSSIQLPLHVLLIDKKMVAYVISTIAETKPPPHCLREKKAQTYSRHMLTYEYHQDPCSEIFTFISVVHKINPHLFRASLIESHF